MTFKQLQDAIDEFEKWNGLDENPREILNILRNFNPRKKKQEFNGVTITRCKDITHDDYDCILFGKYYEINIGELPKPDSDYITINVEYIDEEDQEELESLGVDYDSIEPL